MPNTSGKITALFFILLVQLVGISKGQSQEYASQIITRADTNSFGNVMLVNYNAWHFSFDAPEVIRDGRSLMESQPVNMRDFSALKSDERWQNYGWFELILEADSTIAGVPWLLTHQGYAPARIWLNGVLVLQNGNPSPLPEEEVLSRFLNSALTGIILREGFNYLLLEHSEHNVHAHFTFWRTFKDGISVMLFRQMEPYLRRSRAFMFGSAVMLLLLLVFIHTYLAVKFKGQYHTYVALTTLSLLLIAFTTLSDSVFNWTYAYLPFFEFSYVISLVLVAYFFLISVRMIYALTVPWRTLTVLGILFIGLGIIAIYVNRSWLNIIHPVMLVTSLVYTTYSLWLAKKHNPDAPTGVVTIGILITVLGSVLYTSVYIAFNLNIHALFVLSVLMSFTGIPVALTFNVAVNYTNLFATLEKKVASRTAELEAANIYQRRFFDNVSHEFRTPLTISMGLVNKALQNAEEQDRSLSQKDLNSLDRNLNRLSDMLNQIVDLTKSDQHILTLDKRYFYGEDCIRLRVESFRSLAEQKQQSFQYFEESEQTILFADPEKLEIILNNLISNAIKFTPKGGKIAIRTFLEKNHFYISVTDTGSGISQANEERVFERFYRIKRPETEYVEGMGVGLEVSRTLARLHHGDITVRNVDPEKGGAQFLVSLPLPSISEIPQPLEVENFQHRKVEAKIPIVSEFEDSHKASEKPEHTILLVEDNPDMMAYVAEILGVVGTVITAENGKEALALLQKVSPDVIISDIMMPEMGGLELINTLANHPQWSKIPVIILTAQTLDDVKLNVLRIGVLDYITKPFDPRHLVLKAKNLLSYHDRRMKISVTLKNSEESRMLSEQIIEFIKKNVSDKDLTTNTLIEEFPKSRRSLYRALESEIGMTPSELIREIRLQTARELVKQSPTYRLEELADAVGYTSATSFRKAYEKQFGVHPLQIS